MFYLAGLTFAGVACGSGHGKNPGTPDGGTTGKASLEVLDPPGQEVGLAYGETVSLRVRFLDATGAPQAGVDVDFAISSGADAAGSTLSAGSDVTDGAGIARVDLVAGAQRRRSRSRRARRGRCPRRSRSPSTRTASPPSP
jgi:hypothetical protein